MNYRVNFFIFFQRLLIKLTQLFPDPGDPPAISGIHATSTPSVPPPAPQCGAPGFQWRREECFNGQGTVQGDAINGG